MSEIHPHSRLVTLINTFRVQPEDQDRLVEHLARSTQDVMLEQPGFISANIHRSLDGTRVANYAQWRSLDDFKAMQRDPEAQAHMKEAAALCESFEPVFYEVESSHASEKSDNKGLALRLLDGIYNRGDVDVMAELMDPDIVLRTPFPSPAFDSLEGLKLTIHDMIAEGEQVVSFVTVTGTREGAPVAFDEVIFLRLRDGKVVEHRALADAGGSMMDEGRGKRHWAA
jgi:heme-degrading monooxygenase HmoA/ketosteroid isomerase-like protein